MVGKIMVRARTVIARSVSDEAIHLMTYYSGLLRYVHYDVCDVMKTITRRRFYAT
jgi:hypothetical protein